MMIELNASDGHTMQCWTAPAKGRRNGGVIVLQEIFGVTEQLKGIATRYAALGYDVAVPALFDRQRQGTVIPFNEASRGLELALSSDLEQTMADVNAAVAELAKTGGKVAVIGFCWGGGLAIRAAQVLDIACAVSFYGTRLTQYLDKPQRAPLLGHFGSKDDHVPTEMLEQAKSVLPDMEVYMYEAGHAFANDARASFVQEAAQLAHQRTEAFLATHLS